MLAKIVSYILFFLTLALPTTAFAKNFTFSDEPVDVVIPCVNKDLFTLQRCIEGIKKHGKPIRRVIVVSRERLTDSAEWFDENNYPFTKMDVAYHLCSLSPQSDAFLSTKPPRVGWYYQQLLKMYAPLVIPGISSNVLLLDADTIFLRKVQFLAPTKAGNYCYGTEHHKPYFEHAKKLLPCIKKQYPYRSGICHHMVMQKPVLEDLMKRVETRHGLPFWQVFCQNVNPKDYSAGASEYEIYFNYFMARSTQGRLRPLKWANIRSLKHLKEYRDKGYDYVSCHDWSRKQ